MMRLAVYTIIGWALAVTGNDAVRQTSTDVVPPDAGRQAAVLVVAQLDPGAQAGDDAAATPGTDVEAGPTADAAAGEPPAGAEAEIERRPPDKKPPRPRRSQKPGWVDDLDREPQTSIIKRILRLVDSVDEIDPEGKMHKKISDADKDKIRSTLMEIDFDMQRLIQGDPSIAERDPNKKKYVTEDEEREALRDRTMARPKPKPPFAKTPGVVKKDKDERVYEERSGRMLEGGQAVNAGTPTPHGTVIHRGKFYRSGRTGRGRGVRTPKIIVVPPSQRPAPPAEPTESAEPTSADSTAAEPAPADATAAEPAP